MSKRTEELAVRLEHGYAQLQRVEELIDKKRWILQAYRDRLNNLPDLELNPEPPDGRNEMPVGTRVVSRPGEVVEAADLFASLRPLLHQLDRGADNRQARVADRIVTQHSND